MAIDWKTIISEFDGKPTLLQAIGKLRKAVEEETMTIQQAQAEIAKLESQQKTDEQAIATAQTTANNALDLAKTNEKDIGTLDGQVAQMGQDILNLQNEASLEITLTPATATSGTLTSEQFATLELNDNCYIKLNDIVYTLSKRNPTQGYSVYSTGYLSDTKAVQTITITNLTKGWVMTSTLVSKPIYEYLVYGSFHADPTTEIGVQFTYFSTKKYEFNDPFDFNMLEPIINTILSLKVSPNNYVGDSDLRNAFLYPSSTNLMIQHDGANIVGNYNYFTFADMEAGIINGTLLFHHRREC